MCLLLFLRMFLVSYIYFFFVLFNWVHFYMAGIFRTGAKAGSVAERSELNILIKRK